VAHPRDQGAGCCANPRELRRLLPARRRSRVGEQDYEATVTGLLVVVRPYEVEPERTVVAASPTGRDGGRCALERRSVIPPNDRCLSRGTRDRRRNESRQPAAPMPFKVVERVKLQPPIDSDVTRSNPFPCIEVKRRRTGLRALIPHCLRECSAVHPERARRLETREPGSAPPNQVRVFAWASVRGCTPSGNVDLVRFLALLLGVDLLAGCGGRPRVGRRQRR
jgi:hypothetical protein